MGLTSKKLLVKQSHRAGTGRGLEATDGDRAGRNYETRALPAASSARPSGTRHSTIFAPANRAIAPPVVCAAFNPRRKSLSEKVAYTSIG